MNCSGDAYLISFEEETYPPRFLELAGLNLPPTNAERQGGRDIRPGSDNEDDEEDEDYVDPERELAHLQQLTIREDAPAPALAPAPSSTDEPTNNDHQPSSRTFVEIKGGFYMRVVEFLQPGRTIGTGQLAQTRDMITVQLTLPGGVQVNTVEASIHSAHEIKFAWDYHPADFMANYQTPEGLRDDYGYLDFFQQKLNKEWKAIADQNGRLGESFVHKLKELPQGKKLSKVEGFINPHTFLPPGNDDPVTVNRMDFNVVDNTSPAVNVIVCVLIERERTQSVRRNRHRAVAITNPDIESLPTSLLPQLASLIDTPGSPASRLAGGDLPDLMDTDGTIYSGAPRRRQANGEESARRVVGRGRRGQRSPRQAESSQGSDGTTNSSTRAGRANDRVVTFNDMQHQRQQQQPTQPSVVPNDTHPIPSLSELMRMNEGSSAVPAENPSPISDEKCFFDATRGASFETHDPDL